MTTGREDFDAWLPVQYGDEAIERLVETSSVERFARVEPMAEDTKNVPRFRDFQVGNVAKGDAYAKSESEIDRIDLIARKVGGYDKIAEEDITGSLQADPLQPMRNAAADALARNFSNSCLAVTAAANGTTVKYNSVYRVVTTNGTGFDAGYTANDNYDSITRADFKAAGAGKGYDTLSDLLGLHEVSDVFEDLETIVIAHPTVKGLFRGMKNAVGDPLLAQVGIDPFKKPQYQIFGYDIVWDKAAKTSAVDVSRPTGNPLLVLGNRRHLVRGARALSPQIPADSFGWAMQTSANGDGFLSDEALVKAAFKRAFVVGTAQAFCVLEILP